MNQETINEVAIELGRILVDRFPGKMFQLSPLSLAIDFRLRSEGYLFISVDPSAPRIYLIKRIVRELEKSSISPSPFIQALRAKAGSGKLLSVAKYPNERVVRLSFTTTDDLGDEESCDLVVQLTGRSANLFLLNSAGIITHALRAPKGAGQQIDDAYAPPPQSGSRSSEDKEPRITPSASLTISQACDEHYRDLDARLEFEAAGKDLLGKLRKEITKLRKLRTNLGNDLVAHGDAEEHKRVGDLLLANISTAERHGNTVKLTDYYADNAPTIELEVDENMSLQDAAADYFSRYGKSKRALEEIDARLEEIESELIKLEARKLRLEEAIATGDLSALKEFSDARAKPVAATPGKKKDAATLPGVRHYRSSDGFELLVGRTARDNDNLTFRVARPNDLWLHAGDYPGSHVIVRNSSKKEVPHRTVIEAAQLAAKFSQAGKDSKVIVHYTPRKFLMKPKGAAPGLVRMSNFRSITVEPGENVERW